MGDPKRKSRKRSPGKQVNNKPLKNFTLYLDESFDCQEVKAALSAAKYKFRVYSQDFRGGEEDPNILPLVGKRGWAMITCADVEAAVGPVGRVGSASADWSAHSQVLTYSALSHGLFAGVPLTSGEIKYDNTSTATLYGKQVSILSILSGDVPAPPGRARDSVKAVDRRGATSVGTKPSGIRIPSFPWPPPAASADEVIPRATLEQGAIPKSLGDVEARLASALRANGYVERSYYAVPDGFALVTRLEQIGSDGTSKPPPGRWSLSSRSASDFTLSDYVRALFTADPGYYRVIVFRFHRHPGKQLLRKQRFGSKEASTFFPRRSRANLTARHLPPPC